MLTSIQAVIFDMDGVIFDSERVYFDAFFVAAKKNNITADADFVHSFEGKNSATCYLILQQFLNNDMALTQQFVQDWGQARQAILHEQGLPFKAGFLTLFEAIKASGRTMGLVTSSNRADMMENFARHDEKVMQHFAHIVTLEDVTNPKPHPEPYQLMMRQLGVSPQACVVIEDSPPGVSAAVNAGANTIMISEHAQPDSDIAEKLWYRSHHHDDILAFLRRHQL